MSDFENDKYKKEEYKESLYDAEQAAIGCMLLDYRLVRTFRQEGGSAEWFQAATLREAVEAICKLDEDDQAIDLIIVMNKVPTFKNQAMHCIDAAVTTVHFKYYLAIINDAYISRKAIESTSTLLGDLQAYQPAHAIKLQIDALQAIINESAMCTSDVINIKDFNTGAVEEFNLIHQEKIVKGNKDFMIGIPMPWWILNSLYCGLKPDLHIIAARPSQGKTALAVNISTYWSWKGIRHLFICLDMRTTELVKRYACLSGRVSLPKLANAPTYFDIENYAIAEKEIKDQAMVDISSCFFMKNIERDAFKAVRDGCKAIILDYIQLVNGVGTGREPKHERVGMAIQKLKQLAHALAVPIVVLTQLSREAAKDQTRAPELHELGDSGEIERVAATVMIIHQDYKVRKKWEYDPPFDIAFQQEGLARTVRPIWLILAKNQQGPIGKRPVIMYPKYFIMRPGDYDAPPAFIKDKNGINTKEIDNEPFFRMVRDDFRTLPEDDELDAANALGERGETIKGKKHE